MPIDEYLHTSPNECWYQEDDGTMVPCKRDIDPYFFFALFKIILWPYITLGIGLIVIVIFIKKRR